MFYVCYMQGTLSEEIQQLKGRKRISREGKKIKGQIFIASQHVVKSRKVHPGLLYCVSKYFMVFYSRATFALPAVFLFMMFNSRTV